MLSYEYFKLKEETINGKRYSLRMNTDLYGRNSGILQFTIVKSVNGINTTLVIKEFLNCKTAKTIRAKKQKMNKEFYQLIDYLKEAEVIKNDIKNEL